MASNVIEHMNVIAKEYQLQDDHGVRRFLLLAKHAPPAAAIFVQGIGNTILQMEGDVRLNFDRFFRHINVSTGDSATYIGAETARHCFHLGMSVENILKSARGQMRMEAASVLSREKAQQHRVSPQFKRTAAGTMPARSQGPVQSVPPPGPVRHVPPPSRTPHYPLFPPGPVTKKRP